MTDVPSELAKYGAPSWLIFVAVIVLWFLSTRWAAHLPGKLGAWSRWITNRQERSLDREMNLHREMNKAVRERVEAEVGPIRADNAALSKELDDLRVDFTAERVRHREEIARHLRTLADERERHRVLHEPVLAERDLLAAWSVHVSRWWNDKARALAEMGIEVPPPPWPSFQAWLDDITRQQNREIQG